MPPADLSGRGHKNGFMLFYSDMSNMAACSACITVISVKIQMWKKIQNPGRRQILLTYRISGVFHAGKFWWKWGFKGVLNFHRVLFSLFQVLSMKMYSRVYFSLCLFLGGFREVAKIKPTRKIPHIRYIGKIYQHMYMKYGHWGIRLSETYCSLQKWYLMEFFLHICLSYYDVSYKIGLTLKFIVLFWTEQLFSFHYGPFQVTCRHLYHLVFLQFKNQIMIYIKQCNS